MFTSTSTVAANTLLSVRTAGDVCLPTARANSQSYGARLASSCSVVRWISSWKGTKINRANSSVTTSICYLLHCRNRIHLDLSITFFHLDSSICVCVCVWSPLSAVTIVQNMVKILLACTLSSKFVSQKPEFVSQHSHISWRPFWTVVPNWPTVHSPDNR